MSVTIPVVLGTGRDERQSEAVARYVHEILSSNDSVNTPFVDVREYLVSPFTIPGWVEDENASKWRKIASEASGFVFVVPEYNHSFPGEFKLLLDSAYEEYKDTYALLVGVSSGQYGGVRVIQHLAPVCHELNIHLTGMTVATTHVKKLFGEGEEGKETYEAIVKKSITELITHVTS